MRAGRLDRPEAEDFERYLDQSRQRSNAQYQEKIEELKREVSEERSGPGPSLG